jgi:hypothetical protein
MERERVTELHFITPRTNLASIAEKGILSHRRATRVAHTSIALEDVQDRRKDKRVPNGRPLHEYANTYFDARNPMMSRRRDERHEIAVVRISPDVLDLDGVVITDGNAAADATRFFRSPEGLADLDEGAVYAEWWTDSDYWTYLEKKRMRCAELLVPDIIEPQYLLGCYVLDADGVSACQEIAPNLEAVVRGHVFF